MNVAIIGAGLMGQKRAHAASLCNMNIKYVSDINHTAATDLAKKYCASVTDWQKAISDSSVELVFVCTPHNHLAEISLRSIENGKHVLVEKPAVISFSNIEQIGKALKNANMKKYVAYKMGFNHRYHPMIARMKNLVDSGLIGDLLFITGEYGHGGRGGMENEWRCNKKHAGGGELLDQGSHMIDLYRYFFGDIIFARGIVQNLIYKSKDPVEDTAFFMLQNSKGNVGQFHVSWNLWKNSFFLKLVGTKAIAIVTGLGKSYGVEKLQVYMRGDLGTIHLEETYDGEDMSFRDEIKNFLTLIETKQTTEDQIQMLSNTIHAIHEIYKQNGIPF